MLAVVVPHSKLQCMGAFFGAASVQFVPVDEAPQIFLCQLRWKQSNNAHQWGSDIQPSLLKVR